MIDTLLIVAVIPFFLFGFYIMKKVDQFIYENEKRVNEEMKMREPSSVKISGDMSLIEIDREIDKFRQNHPNFEIILKEENNNPRLFMKNNPT